MTHRAMRLLCCMILPVAALLLSGCALLPLDRTPPERPVLYVASWNAEWLGAPERRTDSSRGHLRNPTDIAEYIRASRADALALFELENTARAETPQSAVLDEALAELSRERGHRWEYRMIPLPVPHGQHMAVAWNNRRLELEEEPEPLDLPGDRRFEGRTLLYRTPAVFSFRMQHDEEEIRFQFVPVHFQASYGGDDLFPHRRREADLLVSALPGDGDTLVATLNIPFHTEPAVAILEEEGWRDLNVADMRTHLDGAALDRIFAPTDSRFDRAAFRVFSAEYLRRTGMTEEEFRLRLSDHWMVVLELPLD